MHVESCNSRPSVTGSFHLASGAQGPFDAAVFKFTRVTPTRRPVTCSSFHRDRCSMRSATSCTLDSPPELSPARAGPCTPVCVCRGAGLRWGSRTYLFAPSHQSEVVCVLPLTIFNAALLVVFKMFWEGDKQ